MMKRLLACIVLGLTCSAFATIHTVAVSGLSFSPANITVQQGDTVRWVKTSGFHNVSETSATPVFRSGNATGSPFTYDFAFDAPLVGTYNYRCEVHAGSGMVGSVTVEAPAPCDPPEDLVIKWEADNQVGVYWTAPQAGQYDIYGTADPTLNTAPPGAGWVFVNSVNIAVPGPASAQVAGLVDIFFFVAVQNCAP